VHLNALLERFLDLPIMSRHILDVRTFQAALIDLLGADPKGAAGDIHGDVAAPDGDDSFADARLLAEVGGLKKREGEENSVGVGSRNRNAFWKSAKPLEIRTASKSSTMSLSFISLPISTRVLMVTPSEATYPTSQASLFRGRR